MTGSNCQPGFEGWAGYCELPDEGERRQHGLIRPTVGGVEDATEDITMRSCSSGLLHSIAPKPRKSGTVVDQCLLTPIGRTVYYYYYQHVPHSHIYPILLRGEGRSPARLVHSMFDDDEGARDLPKRTGLCESLIHLGGARWDLSFLVRRPGGTSDGIVLLLPYAGGGNARWLPFPKTGMRGQPNAASTRWAGNDLQQVVGPPPLRRG